MSDISRRDAVKTAAVATALVTVGTTAVAQGKKADGQSEAPDDSPSISGTPTIRTKSEADRAMGEAKKLAKRPEGGSKEIKANSTQYKYVYGNCLYQGLLGRWHWWSNHDSSSLCDSTYKWSAPRGAVVDHYEFFTCPDGCRAGWIKIRVG